MPNPPGSTVDLHLDVGVRNNTACLCSWGRFLLCWPCLHFLRTRRIAFTCVHVHRSCFLLLALFSPLLLLWFLPRDMSPSLRIFVPASYTILSTLLYPPPKTKHTKTRTQPTHAHPSHIPPPPRSVEILSKHHRLNGEENPCPETMTSKGPRGLPSDCSPPCSRVASCSAVDSFPYPPPPTAHPCCCQ